MTQWCIDENQVVHAVICNAKGLLTTPYLSKPADYKEMAVHLQKPDTQHMIINQSGNSMLKPCPLCIPA